MARIRSIKPAFFTSEDTCTGSPLSRLLFLGLGIEADKAGRLKDRPRELKRRLLPEDDCDPDALLWELVARHLIRRYTSSDGQMIIQILNFAKHQKPHPKEPDSVLPEDGEDRKPCFSTASREPLVHHPVENPSTTARNGSGDLSNGYGSGDHGSGDLGAGTGTHRGVGLVIGGATYEKLLESHAYVGAKLRVPKVLHAELVTKSGANADTELRAWYATLDEELEGSGKGTGDVFQWLRPRHQAFAQAQGWIDPLTPQKPAFDGIEAAEARLRKAGRL